MKIVPFSDFRKKYRSKHRAWQKYRRAFFGLSFGARDFHIAVDDLPKHDMGGVGGEDPRDLNIREISRRIRGLQEYRVMLEDMEDDEVDYLKEALETQIRETYDKELRRYYDQEVVLRAEYDERLGHEFDVRLFHEPRKKYRDVSAWKLVPPYSELKRELDHHHRTVDLTDAEVVDEKDVLPVPGYANISNIRACDLPVEFAQFLPPPHIIHAFVARYEHRREHQEDHMKPFVYKQMSDEMRELVRVHVLENEDWGRSAMAHEVKSLGDISIDVYYRFKDGKYYFGAEGIFFEDIMIPYFASLPYFYRLYHTLIVSEGEFTGAGEFDPLTEFVENDDYVVAGISSHVHAMFLIKDNTRDSKMIYLIDPHGAVHDESAIKIIDFLNERILTIPDCPFTSVSFLPYPGDQGYEGTCGHLTLLRMLSVALAAAHYEGDSQKKTTDFLSEPISCVLVTFVVMVVKIFQVILSPSKSRTDIIGMTRYDKATINAPFVDQDPSPESDQIYNRMYGAYEALARALVEIHNMPANDPLRADYANEAKRSYAEAKEAYQDAVQAAINQEKIDIWELHKTGNLPFRRSRVRVAGSSYENASTINMVNEDGEYFQIIRGLTRAHYDVLDIVKDYPHPNLMRVFQLNKDHAETELLREDIVIHMLEHGRQPIFKQLQHDLTAAKNHLQSIGLYILNWRLESFGWSPTERVFKVCNFEDILVRDEEKVIAGPTDYSKYDVTGTGDDGANDDEMLRLLFLDIIRQVSARDERSASSSSSSHFPRKRSSSKHKMNYSVRIERSPNETKKFRATIRNDLTGRVRAVDFGQRGASDYTKHGDYERMVRYLTRHHAVFRSRALEKVRSSRERWGIDGIHTAGFWSRWLLWSAPSLEGARRKIRSVFRDQIRFVKA